LGAKGAEIVTFSHFYILRLVHHLLSDGPLGVEESIGALVGSELEQFGAELI